MILVTAEGKSSKSCRVDDVKFGKTSEAGLESYTNKARKPLSAERYSHKVLSDVIVKRNADSIRGLLSKNLFDPATMEKLESNFPPSLLYHKTLQKFRDEPKKKINVYPQYREPAIAQALWPSKSNLRADISSDVSLDRSENVSAEKVMSSSNKKMDDSGDGGIKPLAMQVSTGDRNSNPFERRHITDTEPSTLNDQTDLIKFLSATRQLGVGSVSCGLSNRSSDGTTAVKNESADECGSRRHSERNENYGTDNKGYRDAHLQFNSTPNNGYFDREIELRGGENNKDSVVRLSSMDGVHEPHGERTLARIATGARRHFPSPKSTGTIDAVGPIEGLFPGSNLSNEPRCTSSNNESKSNSTEKRATINHDTDGPKFKIRVRSGSVVLTLRSESTERITEKPEEEKIPVLISKLTGERKDRSDADVAGSVVRGLLTAFAGGTDGDCQGDPPLQSNRSCYYAGTMEQRDPGRVLIGTLKKASDYNGNRRSDSKNGRPTRLDSNALEKLLENNRRTNGTVSDAFTDSNHGSENNLINPTASELLKSRRGLNGGADGPAQSNCDGRYAPSRDSPSRPDYGYLKYHFRPVDVSPSGGNRTAIADICQPLAGLHPASKWSPSENDTLKKLETLKMLKLYLDFLCPKKDNGSD